MEFAISWVCLGEAWSEMRHLPAGDGTHHIAAHVTHILTWFADQIASDGGFAWQIYWTSNPVSHVSFRCKQIPPQSTDIPTRCSRPNRVSCQMELTADIYTPILGWIILDSVNVIQKISFGVPCFSPPDVFAPLNWNATFIYVRRCVFFWCLLEVNKWPWTHMEMESGFGWSRAIVACHHRKIAILFCQAMDDLHTSVTWKVKWDGSSLRVNWGFADRKQGKNKATFRRL